MKKIITILALAALLTAALVSCGDNEETTTNNNETVAETKGDYWETDEVLGEEITME